MSAPHAVVRPPAAPGPQHVVHTHPGPPLPADSKMSGFVRWLRLRRVLVGQAVRTAVRLSGRLGRATPRLWVLPESHPEVLRLTRGDLVLTTGLLDRPDRLEGALALALCQPPVGPLAGLRARTAAWVGWRLSQVAAGGLGLPQVGRLVGLLLDRLPSRDRGGETLAADRRAVQLVGPHAVRHALQGISPRPVGGRLAVLRAFRVLGGPAQVASGPPPNWLRLHRLFGPGRVLPFPLEDLSAHLVPLDPTPVA